MNCIQDKCKFLDEDYNDNYICTKNNIIISDEQYELFENLFDKTENVSCKDFEELKSCKNCRFSRVIEYESGVIDSLDYHCPLQEGKMIYSDISPYRNKNIDFPECNIDKWESDGF